MCLLRLPAPRSALVVVHATWAVGLAPIAATAEMEDPATVIQNALNLPEIVHSRPRPQRTRPPAGTRATTPGSNASTRGDSGLGGDDSGPHCFGAVGGIVRSSRPLGQLLRQTGLLRFPRFSVAADRWIQRHGDCYGEADSVAEFESTSVRASAPVMMSSNSAVVPPADHAAPAAATPQLAQSVLDTVASRLHRL